MGPDWLKFLVINIFLYFSDSLGKGQATKSDEFSEKCQRGGTLSIQIFIIYTLIKVFFGRFSKTNCNIPNHYGGVI